MAISVGRSSRSSQSDDDDDEDLFPPVMYGTRITNERAWVCTCDGEGNTHFSPPARLMGKSIYPMMFACFSQS